jgi:hypothetical protein
MTTDSNLKIRATLIRWTRRIFTFFLAVALLSFVSANLLSLVVKSIVFLLGWVLVSQIRKALA